MQLDMLERLKRFIENAPDRNNYLRLLKSHVDKSIFTWVKEQLPHINNINEKIYLLTNDVEECQKGNTKKFLDYRRGYGYCGRAEVCECLQEKCATASKPLSDVDKNSRNERIYKTKLEKYGDKNITIVKNIKIPY